MTPEEIVILMTNAKHTRWWRRVQRKEERLEAAQEAQEKLYAEQRDEVAARQAAFEAALATREGVVELLRARAGTGSSHLDRMLRRAADLLDDERT
jgi:hypothetical protein